ncbi:MAG TPA: hypothetical protein VH083_05005, partial [Myxococcales bacterium]|nr:hypothetical protein [Myxococcales bacterium]
DAMLRALAAEKNRGRSISTMGVIAANVDRGVLAPADAVRWAVGLVKMHYVNVPISVATLNAAIEAAIPLQDYATLIENLTRESSDKQSIVIVTAAHLVGSLAASAVWELARTYFETCVRAVGRRIGFAALRQIMDTFIARAPILPANAFRLRELIEEVASVQM